jgi:membrane associated rhomboid family serine protease
MTNRWSIAVARVLLQIALGAVYAWSVFRVPLTKQFGWRISEVTLTFTISIFVLGIAAFFGGLCLNRKGPRIVALTGGFLYGAGVPLASLSDHSLWWLYLTYGVIGGSVMEADSAPCRRSPLITSDRRISVPFMALCSRHGDSRVHLDRFIAYMRQASGVHRGALHVIAAVMAASMLLPFIVSPPQRVDGQDRARSAETRRVPAA